MSTFVKIVAITMSALVFLLVLWPALSGLMKSAGKTGECNWNLFLAALTKQVTMGFGEIPIGCQAEYTTVDSDMLSKLHRLANKRITKYHSLAPPEESGYVGLAAATPNVYYLEAAKKFPLSGNRPSYDALNEWALDSIVAKKMQQCWDKVWHGKLDIVTRFKASQRVFCITCSVISFSDDLPVSLKTTPSNNFVALSLYNWMNVEPYYKTTYYDYVYDGTGIKAEPPHLAFTTNLPLSVTYVEQWRSWAARLWAPIGATLAAGGALVLGAFGVINAWNPLGYVALGGATLLVGATAGAVTYAATADQPIRALVLQPYEFLQKPPDQGGLGCTDIIA